MSHFPAPIPNRYLTRAGFGQLPTLIATAGERARRRFIEFFTANIRNPNTRRAYGRAVSDFFAWCSEQRVGDLAHISPTVVAAYVEQLQHTHAKPSVKQHLAAVRMLFDWLVVGQVVPVNPAHSVRGPKHVIKRGKTPALTAEETRQLLDAIRTDTIAGLRDRALIGTMVYSFARIGAALAMKVQDYYPEGKRWRLRLHEKGGKEHVVPVHHTLEEYLDAYLDVSGIRFQPKGPFACHRSRTTAVQPLARTVRGVANDPPARQSRGHQDEDRPAYAAASAGKLPHARGATSPASMADNAASGRLSAGATRTGP